MSCIELLTLGILSAMGLFILRLCYFGRNNSPYFFFFHRKAFFFFVTILACKIFVESTTTATVDLEKNGRPRTRHGLWASPDNVISSETKQETTTSRLVPARIFRILQSKKNAIRSCDTTTCNSGTDAQKALFLSDVLWNSGQLNDTHLAIRRAPRLQEDMAYNDKNKNFFDVSLNRKIKQTPPSVSHQRNVTQYQRQPEGGAVSKKSFRLSLNFSLDLMRYEAVYNLSRVNSLMIREKIYWAWKYLERGTNIAFREAVAEDKLVINVFEGNWCYSTIKAPFYVSLSPQCSTVHTVLHEILHSLGVIHEHQRHDRDKYVKVNTTGLSLRWSNNFKHKPSDYQTDYDLASIMHYPEYVSETQTVLEPRDPRYKSLLLGSRSFLSSCDWALLNHLYPGRRKTFQCKPHQVLRLLLPRPMTPVTEAQCLYENEFLFDTGLCVYKVNSLGYPALLPIEEELGFHPEQPEVQLRNLDFSNPNSATFQLYSTRPSFFAAEGPGVSLSVIAYAYVAGQLAIDVVSRN